MMGILRILNKEFTLFYVVTPYNIVNFTKTLYFVSTILELCTDNNAMRDTISRSVY